MTQYSWFWGGTETGDAGPYTDDDFSDVLSKVFQNDRTSQSVLYGIENSLNITNPSGSTVRVATGWAIVDGKFYRNSANVDFVLDVPVATRYYTIILKKDFTAQTVRLASLGPDEIDFPIPTQNDGTVWEVEIARVEITSGGVVTITDVRDFCRFSTKISGSLIEINSLPGSRLQDNTVENEKLTDETITPAKILNRTRRFYVPVEEAHDGSFAKINKRSGGFGWDTSASTYTYFRGAFVVPEDFVSGMRVYALFSNHTLSSAQIVANFSAYSHALSGSPDAGAEVHELNEICVIASGVTYIDLYLDLTDLDPNDIVELQADRNGSHEQDTASAPYSGQFHGFMARYTADS